MANGDTEEESKEFIGGRFNPPGKDIAAKADPNDAGGVDMIGIPVVWPFACKKSGYPIMTGCMSPG